MALSDKIAAKHGQNWAREVNLFDPSSSTLYIIEDNSLTEVMGELIDTSEEILQIWIYKCPLSGWQLTKLLLNHQFVVFETQSWWWSIEKDDKRILIQRGKYLSTVRDFVSSEPRKQFVTPMSYDKGRKTLEDLIHFLYDTDELNIKYDLLENNCKDFAKRIFDEFAARKFHDKIGGSECVVS